MNTIADKLAIKVNTEPVVKNWSELKMKASFARTDDVIQAAIIITDNSYEPVICDSCGEDCKRYKTEVGFVSLVTVFRDGILSEISPFRLCARCFFEATCEDKEAGDNPSPPYISFGWKIKNPNDREYRNGGFFPPK